MPQQYSYTDEIATTDNAGVTTHSIEVHTITWADADITARAAFLSSLEDGVRAPRALQAQDAAWSNAQAALMAAPDYARQYQGAISGPQYLTVDGNRGFMADDSLVSMGTGGLLYLDGRRMVGLATKAVIAGKALYKQAPDTFWYLWTGSGWQKVTDFDANVLK